MLVLGARLQMLNSVGIGLFSLNSFISWKGKKFNTKENEWFSAMIALNIHRPEAHLEIRGFNASGFVCLFVLFSHWQNSQKKPKKPVYISCWVVRRKDQEAEGLPGRLALRRADLLCCCRGDESTSRSGSGLSALRSGMAMCRSYEGTGVSLKRNTHVTCPMLG